MENVWRWVDCYATDLRPKPLYKVLVIMAETPKKTAIRIEGGSNIRVENNVSVGYDELLSAKDVRGLSAKENLALPSPPQKLKKISWYNHQWTMTAVSILGALAIAYLSYRFGWS